MCGISAVYGEYAPIKAMQIVLNQLERGTKGCGVAYMCNGRLEVIKEPTDPISFIDKHYYELDVNANVAIAHNRQPSVGRVCYENTHPFIDCHKRFALAHNGHCFLVGADLTGHKIYGETDSERITHVLEEFYDDSGDMLTAIGRLLKSYLRGAIVVLTRDGELYAGKADYAPLHYAICSGEVYIGSTERAVRAALRLAGANRESVSSLESGEVIRVKKNGEAELYRVVIKIKERHPYDWFSWDW
ncbi:MAG: class II glutamine amidotransferase [Ignisphaera sp.]